VHIGARRLNDDGGECFLTIDNREHCGGSGGFGQETKRRHGGIANYRLHLAAQS
jgi:hypothetical protein